MQIDFNHIDLFMDEINNRPEIIDLADYIYLHKNLIKRIAMLVREGSTKIRFDAIKRRELLRSITDPTISTEVQGMVDKINNAFDVAFTSPKNISVEFRRMGENDRIGMVRGSILESFVYKLVSSKGYGLVERNCVVAIDNVAQQLPDFLHPQTMDIAGVNKNNDPTNGEIYECKMGPRSMEGSDLRFVELLKNKLKDGNCSGVCVGLVCFDGHAQLNSRISKELRMDAGRYIGYIIAYEDLERLW